MAKAPSYYARRGCSAGFCTGSRRCRCAASPVGAKGVMLVPYWEGCMTPYWDASARGVIVGLSGSTRRGDLYRALLEGVELQQALASRRLQGRGSAIQASPYLEENVPAFPAMAETIHNAGGKLFGLIWYWWGVTGIWQPLAPPAPSLGASVVQFSYGGISHSTREMDKEEIARMVDAHRQSAAHLAQAGYDGMMLHAGHGGLAEHGRAASYRPQWQAIQIGPRSYIRGAPIMRGSRWTRPSHREFVMVPISQDDR